MKKCTMLGLILLHLCSVTLYGQDKIVFAESAYDCGNVDKSVQDYVSHSFVFKNVSKEIIRITQVVTQNSYITATYPTQDIKPNEEGKVEIKIPVVQLGNRFKKTITVRTSSSEVFFLFLSGMIGESYPFDYNAAKKECIMKKTATESVPPASLLLSVAKKSNNHYIFSLADFYDSLSAEVLDEIKMPSNNLKSKLITITLSNDQEINVKGIITDDLLNSGLLDKYIIKFDVNDTEPATTKRLLYLLSNFDIESFSINNDDVFVNIPTAMTIKAMLDKLK